MGYEVMWQRPKIEIPRAEFESASVSTTRVIAPSLCRYHNENMGLELVSDDIGDHAPLDAMVYAVIASDRNEKPPALLLGALLAAVMASAPDKIDKKFLNFMVTNQILEEYSSDPGADENSNLKKLLGWCWQRGSFEKIRRLSEHSSTTWYSYAIYYKTAEILRPMAVHYQADWESSLRYA